MDIATQIAELREAKGLTQADLARRTGIAATNLSRLENGPTNPRLSTLLRIADALDVNIQLVPRSRVIGLKELRLRADAARQRVVRSGLGLSDPQIRLDRQAQLGIDVTVEQEALRRR